MKIGGRGRGGNFPTITMELFDIPETLSPRLAWMRAHSIHVIDNGPDVGYESENRNWRERRFCAYQGEPGRTGMFAWYEAGFGDTEADAITALAINAGLLLWNEAQPSP